MSTLNTFLFKSLRAPLKSENLPVEDFNFVVWQSGDKSGNSLFRQNLKKLRAKFRKFNICFSQADRNICYYRTIRQLTEKDIQVLKQKLFIRYVY